MSSGIRKVLLIQLLLVFLTSVVFLVVSGGFQALSAAFGGLTALSNVLLLAWRRKRSDGGRAMDAQQSLLVLYRSAFERFVSVILLFLLGMVVLRLDPLALLSGFIAGQAALFFYRNE